MSAAFNDDPWLYAAGDLVTGNPLFGNRPRSAGARAAHVAARAGLVAAGYGGWRAYQADPVATMAALEHAARYGWTAAGAALAPVGWRATSLLYARPHRREWIEPLHWALQRHEVFAKGFPPDVRPEFYIHVPRDLFDGRHGVVIVLPDDYVPIGQSVGEIEQIVARKLGATVDELDITWRTGGRDRYVAFRAKARMPANALYTENEDIRELLASPEAGKLLIGLGPGRDPVWIDLDHESPHILINAASGGGKSVTVATLLAQLIRMGTHVVMLDWKRHSHRWLTDVPGVTYLRDPGDIGDTIIALADEGERRNRAADDLTDEEMYDNGGAWPRIVLVMEEATTTIGKLRRAWQVSGGKGPAPAIDRLLDICNMGRAVGIHLLMLAQASTVNLLGGTAIREAFFARIMARASADAWNMLAKDVQPRPVSENINGRAHLVIAGEAHRVQVVKIADPKWRGGRSQALRDFALSGRPPVPRLRDLLPGETAGTRPTGGDGARSISLVTASPGVTLREAAGQLGTTYEALRKALQRAGANAPQPIGKRGRWPLYDEDAIARFHRNRESAPTA